MTLQKITAIPSIGKYKKCSAVRMREYSLMSGAMFNTGNNGKKKPKSAKACGLVSFQ